MKSLLTIFVITLVCGEEYIVTRESTEYLKNHATWEVVDYEDNIFRGWTVEEAKEILGAVVPDENIEYEEGEIRSNLPTSIDWSGGNCDYGVRNQGNCRSSWAFATVEMLSARCCIQNGDKGFLSVQELVSCDNKNNRCRGGWVTWALDYNIRLGGMVNETCFPYNGSYISCPNECTNKSTFKKARVCNCTSGYKICSTNECIKTALTNGPMTLAFEVCSSFFSYKSGIYKCDCGRRYLETYGVAVMGFSNDPECSLLCKASWGENWGDKGYFRIGCETCGIPKTYPNGNVYCEKVK